MILGKNRVNSAYPLSAEVERHIPTSTYSIDRRHCLPYKTQINSIKFSKYIMQNKLDNYILITYLRYNFTKVKKKSYPVILRLIPKPYLIYEPLVTNHRTFKITWFSHENVKDKSAFKLSFGIFNVRYVLFPVGNLGCFGDMLEPIKSTKPHLTDAGNSNRIM